MKKIAYDPVKDRIAQSARYSSIMRRILYFLLDVVFLRSFYVRSLVRNYGKEFCEKDSWRVLDAGSGLGQYDRFLLAQFSNVNITAIDLKEEYLRDCERYFKKDIERQRITFSNQDICSLPYEDEFDLIISIDVLEHIEDDQLVLENIQKSMKTGGVFIMHSPSTCFSEADEYLVDEHFRQGYSQDDIAKKLTAAGLKPIETGYTYGIAGHTAWLLAVRIPMLLMSKYKLFSLLVLLIYLPAIFPLSLVLNIIDLNIRKRTGRGIYAVGKKIDCGQESG